LLKNGDRKGEEKTSRYCNAIGSDWGDKEGLGKSEGKRPEKKFDWGEIQTFKKWEGYSKPRHTSACPCLILDASQILRNSTALITTKKRIEVLTTKRENDGEGMDEEAKNLSSINI